MKLPALSAIYDRYATFVRLARDAFAGSLAGKLFLRSGLDAAGVAEIAAAGIAGACSLCVDPDGERLRQGLRAGFCDFVVGPLDEALRILKNELRRGVPVSVGVIADPAPTLAAMLDRGLQPDLIALLSGDPRRIFADRGAVTLPVQDEPDPATSLIEWTVDTDIARSVAQTARIAAESLDPARPDTLARQHWLDVAPRHLGRVFAGRHCVRMTAVESAAFAASARAQYPAIRITRDGGPL